MCGRYTHKFTWRELHALLNSHLPLPIEFWQSIEDREADYNVSPSDAAPIIKQGGVPAVLAWGIKPAWAKESRPLARAETLAEKPTYRNALRDRRCLVPVSGFYEWRKSGWNAKRGNRPFYIYRADGRPLLLAGL